MIKFKGKIHPLAKAGDTGYDIEAAETVNVAAGETVTIPTGLRLQPSERLLSGLLSMGLALDTQVRPRSSVSKSGILVHIGTIDAGYTGEIKVIITNTGGGNVVISKGDRIAQIVFGIAVSLSDKDFAAVSELDTTERNNNGFGSSGGFATTYPF